jgi:hypothetical protein
MIEREEDFWLNLGFSRGEAKSLVAWERHRVAMRMRRFYSLREIGEAMGVSKERARQHVVVAARQARVRPNGMFESLIGHGIAGCSPKEAVKLGKMLQNVRVTFQSIIGEP